MTTHIERDRAVQEAIVLYLMTGKEKSVNEAFERWLKENPDNEFPITISRKDKQYRAHRIISEEERPACPNCGAAMSLWQVNSHPKNQVGGEYHTQWICPNETTCGYQDDYSELTIQEQIDKHKGV